MYVAKIMLQLWYITGGPKRQKIGEQLQEARERFTAIAETNAASLQVNNNTTVNISMYKKKIFKCIARKLLVPYVICEAILTSSVQII